MKKFIINVQEIQNNEYGDPVRSLLKSGVLTVESRWDALKVARNIAKAENWDGCHWDAPAVVYAESIEGLATSAQAATVIDALKAEEYEEDE